MSYKNDSYLVISNKYGSASSDATAQLFETYDLLRDISIGGSSASGGGFATAGSFLWKLAGMIAPSSFLSVMGGGTALNLPGTSYWSPNSNGTATGKHAAYGIGSLSSYSGFPGYAANVQFPSNSGEIGYVTGGASSLTSSSTISSLVDIAGYTAGVASGMGFGDTFVLPAASIVSGFGSILQSMSPYLGVYGLGATLVGNLLQGTGNAPLAAYQAVTNNILANADTILENKVKNIETVVKMLDAQNDVVKKLLKEQLEGDKKAIDNLGG